MLGAPRSVFFSRVIPHPAAVASRSDLKHRIRYCALAFVSHFFLLVYVFSSLESPSRHHPQQHNASTFPHIRFLPWFHLFLDRVKTGSRRMVRLSSATPCSMRFFLSFRKFWMMRISCQKPERWNPSGSLSWMSRFASLKSSSSPFCFPLSRPVSSFLSFALISSPLPIFTITNQEGLLDER